MKISETTLPFLKNDCLQIFGQETGAAIFQRTETIYRELLQNTEQPKSDAVKEHMQRKLFPPMAYYKALRAKGIDQDKALEYVRRETRQAAAVKH